MWDATDHMIGVGGNTSDRMRYYGQLHGEPLKQLFEKLQIFALPRFREPFGVAFMEAMWAKNVCIGTCMRPYLRKSERAQQIDA